MSKGRRLALVVPLCLLFGAGPVPQDPGDPLIVTLKETKLRSDKRMFARSLATLHEGDRLAFRQKDGPWMNVAFESAVGWIHETAITAREDVRLSGEGVREEFTAAEAGAARKGFNPQVEKRYRASHADLEAAFVLLDVIQERAVTEGDVMAFLEAGGLRPEGGR